MHAVGGERRRVSWALGREGCSGQGKGLCPIHLNQEKGKEGEGACPLPTGMEPGPGAEASGLQSWLGC